jgi:flagellar protein FlgJ
VHTHGATLSIRTAPSTGATEIGTLENGTPLTIACRRWGRFISGRVTDTAAWDQLTDGGYVSDAYVRWSPDQPFMPWCGEDPQSVPPASRQAFIAAAVSPARAGMEEYGVPASVTIAQAILESGAGASTLTRVDHSLFGMKCFGSPGPVAVGCRNYGTYECSPGDGCHGTTASFRAYKTVADSYLDHAQALATLDRYRPAFLYIHNPDEFAVQLQKAGYATDGHYANSLIRLMRQYNLYQYDRVPTGVF